MTRVRRAWRAAWPYLVVAAVWTLAVVVAREVLSLNCHSWTTTADFQPGFGPDEYCAGEVSDRLPAVTLWLTVFALLTAAGVALHHAERPVSKRN